MERKGMVLGQADEETRRHLERVLAEFEPVDATGDGAELLRLVEEKDPALVVMDLQLHGEDGLEILPKLRSATNAKILVTGCVSDVLLSQALELGADQCVRCPCSGKALRQTARELLGNE